MKKIVVAFMVGIQVMAFAQTTSSSLPRTISTQGRGEIEVEPDEVNCSFQINVESRKSKGVKMPLAKMEDQLKLQLQKLNIPSTRLDISTDPEQCGATFKACKLNHLSFDEFIKIRSYFEKNIFIDRVQFSYKITKSEQIKKYSEQLLKNAYDNSRSKANALAAALQEKIEGIFALNDADFLEEDKNQLENDINYYEHFTKVKLHANVSVDYAIDPIASNTIMPRVVRLRGNGEKIVPYQHASVSFLLKMEDYEEGDPKIHFEKVKKDLLSTISKSGVKEDNVNSEVNEYEAYHVRYTIDVRGESTIRTLYNALLTNKNVKELEVYNLATSNDSAYSVYEKELVGKALQNTRDKMASIEKITGVKMVRVYEVLLEEDYQEDYEEATAVAVDAAAEVVDYGISTSSAISKVDNLEATINKRVNIRYEIK